MKWNHDRLTLTPDEWLDFKKSVSGFKLTNSQKDMYRQIFGDILKGKVAKLRSEIERLTDENKRLTDENERLIDEHREYDLLISFVMIHESVCDHGDCYITTDSIKYFRRTGKHPTIESLNMPLPKKTAVKGVKRNASNSGNGCRKCITGEPHTTHYDSR